MSGYGIGIDPRNTGAWLEAPGMYLGVRSLPGAAHIRISGQCAEKLVDPVRAAKGDGTARSSTWCLPHRDRQGGARIRTGRCSRNRIHESPGGFDGRVEIRTMRTARTYPSAAEKIRCSIEHIGQQEHCVRTANRNAPVDPGVRCRGLRHCYRGRCGNAWWIARNGIGVDPRS